MSLKNELLKFCKHRVAPQVFIACCKRNIYIYYPENFAGATCTTWRRWCTCSRTCRRWRTTTILKWTATRGTAWSVIENFREDKRQLRETTCRHRRARDASRPIRRSAGLQAVCVSVRPINGTFGNHFFTVVLFDRADDPPVARLKRSTTATYLQSFTAMYTFRDHSIVRQRRKKLDGDGRRSPNPPSTRCGTLVVTRVRRRSPQSRWVYVRSRNVAPNTWSWIVGHTMFITTPTRFWPGMWLCNTLDQS
jgi:hypothetical protein